MNATRPLPLDDVRVLELTRLLAGNYCAWLLASLGAEGIESAAAEIETAGAIPTCLLERAAELRVYRLTVPHEFRGYGLGVVDYLPSLEATAAGPDDGRVFMHLDQGAQEIQQLVIARHVLDHAE